MEQVSSISVVCFTGHRQIPPAQALQLPALLEETIRQLVWRGAVEFRVGGALGFDTVAALKLLEMRARYPVIRVVLCLPCRDQADHWPAAERRIYQEILSAADDVHYETEHYFNGCMLQRNRRLVDGSDVCVAFCDHNGGGTAYTVGYALRQNKELINLVDQLTR